jgi:hypothetical protein
MLLMVHVMNFMNKNFNLFFFKNIKYTFIFIKNPHHIFTEMTKCIAYITKGHPCYKDAKFPTDGPYRCEEHWFCIKNCGRVRESNGVLKRRQTCGRLPCSTRNTRQSTKRKREEEVVVKKDEIYTNDWKEYLN